MAATDKQVTQISMGLYDYDGTFTVVTGYPNLYDVWNFDGRWRTDWLGGSANTRALTGFDRINYGGYRLDLRITYRNSTNAQATALRNLLNDVFPTTGRPRIFKISPDETDANGIYCNLRSSAYGIRREMTIGRQAISLQFSGLYRVKEIPDTFEILKTV